MRMKRWLGAIVIALTCAIAPLAITSCASTARVAYVASGVVDTTADTAMKSWARFVVLNEKAGTPVPESSEKLVRDGYAKYQKAVDAADKAISEYLALKAVNSADGLEAVKAAELAAGKASVELVHLIFQLKGGN